DFAKRVTACEPALGWDPGAFLRSYRGNVKDANELALGDSPLVVPLRKFLDERGRPGWQGTASDLLDELVKLVDDQVTTRKDWPKGPNALGGKLRRLAPNLRRAGLAVDFGHDGTQRQITLSPVKAGGRSLGPLGALGARGNAGDSPNDDND